MPPRKIIRYFSASPDDYPESLIEDLIHHEGVILKMDHQRSIVKRLRWRDKDILVKQPIDKDKRLWIRFLTLFRDCDAVRSLKSMDFLNKNHIQTNIPLFCLEYRQLGMTISSYMVYEYLDGEPVEKYDSEAVLALIRQIHATGYLHGDTQMANFLRQGDRIMTIDSKLKHKVWGRISENLEYIRFARNNPEAQKYLDKSSVWYMIARYAHELANLRGQLKNRLKRLLRRSYGDK